MEKDISGSYVVNLDYDVKEIKVSVSFKLIFTTLLLLF
jgi:hypothetical protein